MKLKNYQFKQKENKKTKMVYTNYKNNRKIEEKKIENYINKASQF